MNEATFAQSNVVAVLDADDGVLDVFTTSTDLQAGVAALIEDHAALDLCCVPVDRSTIERGGLRGLVARRPDATLSERRDRSVPPDDLADGSPGWHP